MCPEGGSGWDPEAVWRRSAGASALVPPRSAPGQAGACRIRVCVRAVTGRGARKPRKSRIKARRLFNRNAAGHGPVTVPGVTSVSSRNPTDPSKLPRRRAASCATCKLQARRTAVRRTRNGEPRGPGAARGPRAGHRCGVYDRRKDRYGGAHAGLPPRPGAPSPRAERPHVRTGRAPSSNA